MAPVLFLQQGCGPVGGCDPATAGVRATLAVPLGGQLAVLRRAVVVRDLLPGQDAAGGHHHAVILGAAVNEPTGGLARVVHVVGYVEGTDGRVLIDRQLVELGQRLVLVVARLVHKVAVGAPRLLGQRLDPRARPRRGLHVGPGARALGPHHLALAQPEGRVQPQPAAHI
eukprot:scaffold14736_cov114-Isochrysis_galbana.AAC.4